MRTVAKWSAGRWPTTSATELATDALEMALRTRRPNPGLLHHTDRGVQYTSTAYGELLSAHHARQSVGRPGTCWDNAVAESFFATLKNELIYRYVWSSLRDERGFAIFSLEQPDGSRVRALGQLPAEITLQAVVRIGAIWTRHAEFGWQVRVNTFELIDRLDRRGIVAFLVAYTTHPVIFSTT